MSEDFVFEYKKSYSSVLTLNGAVSGSITKDINFSVNNNYFYFNDYTNRGQLEISKISLDIGNGIGSPRDEIYFPFDEFEIDFRIENDGNWDIEDIEFSICLYDVKNEYCIYDEDDFIISNDGFKLKEGNREDITLSIVLDAYDLEVGSENYELHFSAVGEIDDSDSAYDGEETIISDYVSFEIVNGQDFVIINEISPSYGNNFKCGEKVTINANAWNIGDTDLDDDEVFVKVYSSELNIDEVVSFDRGIDYMDYEPFSFNFEVPSDLKSGSYKILFGVYNNERLDNKYLFETEDVEAVYEYYLNVEGCLVSEPYIQASLLEDKVLNNEEFSINLKIMNMGDIDETYRISYEGYESWSEIISSPESILSVNANSEGSVNLRLLPNKAGTYEFTLVIESKLGDVFRQPISITVYEKNIFSFFEELELIHLILLILVILIVLVFILIIVANKKKKKKVVNY
jgi:hypothetical protein